MSKKKVGIVILVALISGAVGTIGFYYYSQASQSVNYEATATVYEVLDGDTITVDILEVNDPHEGVNPGWDKIRFAGIDTVENGEEGYEVATDYTKSFIHSASEGKIYLDIDDLASSGSTPYRGIYGRLVAVVYMKIDEQWVNVNAKTLRWGQPKGYCEQTSFVSEFDPSDWLEEDYPYV